MGKVKMSLDDYNTLIRDNIRLREQKLEYETKLAAVEDVIHKEIDKQIKKAEEGASAYLISVDIEEVAISIGLDWGTIEDNFNKAVEDIKNAKN